MFVLYECGKEVQYFLLHINSYFFLALQKPVYYMRCRKRIILWFLMPPTETGVGFRVTEICKKILLFPSQTPTLKLKKN